MGIVPKPNAVVPSASLIGTALYFHVDASSGLIVGSSTSGVLLIAPDAAPKKREGSTLSVTYWVVNLFSSEGVISIECVALIVLWLGRHWSFSGPKLVERVR